MKPSFKKVIVLLILVNAYCNYYNSQTKTEGFWDFRVEYQCAWGWKDSHESVLLSKGFGCDYSGMILGGTLEINHPFNNDDYSFKITGQTGCFREGKLNFHEFAGTQYLSGEWLASGGDNAMWGTGLCCNGKLELSRKVNKDPLQSNTKEKSTVSGSGKITKPIQSSFVGKLIVGETYILKNVLFELSSSKLLPESFPELALLYKELEANPKLMIQLDGHTDINGRKKDNLKLSKKRVKAVKKYLTKRGINSRRIKLKWFGAAQPLIISGNTEERKINRRVEVNVIGNIKQ